MAEHHSRKSDHADKQTSRVTKRLADFLGRRGAVDKAFATGREAADFISDLAAKVTPKPLDQDGLKGRYSDGGIARFKDAAGGMSEYQLGERLRGWERQRQAFQYTALISVLAIPAGAIFLNVSRFVVIGLAALFLFAVLRAVRADYFAWIVEQGRFGGFYDYLTSRLPRNMQVILPSQKRTKRK